MVGQGLVSSLPWHTPAPVWPVQPREPLCEAAGPHRNSPNACPVHPGHPVAAGQVTPPALVLPCPCGACWDTCAGGGTRREHRACAGHLLAAGGPGLALLRECVSSCLVAMTGAPDPHPGGLSVLRS